MRPESALLALLLLGAPAPAQDVGPDPAAIAAAEPEALEADLEPVRAKWKLPALAAAVWQQGRIAAIGAVGRRRADAETPVTREDRWHLGSCTKAMTATLAACLVADKKIRWETTVGEAFGRTDVAIHADWMGVPLHLLLANRAGAPENLDADGLWGKLWAHTGPSEAARLVLVKGVVARAPVAPPGTKNLYSNAGFAIAGAMLEKAAGKPWEALIAERLWKPLGITTGGFGAPDPGPCGHREGPDGPAPVPPGPGSDNPAAIGPAGTVHMSLADWCRFAALHLAEARGKSVSLTPEHWRRLHTSPEGQEYALGWMVTKRDWAGGTTYTHAGSNTMWYCVCWLAPGKDLAVLVCTNIAKDGAKATDEVAAALIRRTLRAK